MSNIKQKVKKTVLVWVERMNIWRAKKNEIKKFKDKRRINIFNKVILSKEQEQEIDNFYLENYGKKIPHTWHRYFSAYTGKFDMQYFPELLYIPEFEYYMIPHKEYAYVFEDKNVLPIIAKQVGVKTPEVVVSKTAGLYRDNNLNCISQSEVLSLLYNGKFFLKPSVGSWSGTGCRIADIKKGNDVNTGDSIKKICKMLGENFVVQKIIECHESIKKLHPQSVNTFRVITYRWKNDIKVCPISMRIGVGNNYLDNAHAGGIFVAVNADGTLYKTAFSEFNMKFCEHPDTHIRFDGYKVKYLDKVITAAQKMHFAIPQVGVVNWDFTIDEEGEAVLIEANIRGGGIWLPEMAHGKSAFEDNTEEILKWLRLMRQTKVDEREKINYGNFRN